MIHLHEPEAFWIQGVSIWLQVPPEHCMHLLKHVLWYSLTGPHHVKWQGKLVAKCRICEGDQAISSEVHPFYVSNQTKPTINDFLQKRCSVSAQVLVPQIWPLKGSGCNAHKSQRSSSVWPSPHPKTAARHRWYQPSSNTSLQRTEAYQVWVHCSPGTHVPALLL